MSTINLWWPQSSSKLVNTLCRSLVFLFGPFYPYSLLSVFLFAHLTKLRIISVAILQSQPVFINIPSPFSIPTPHPHLMVHLSVPEDCPYTYWEWAAHRPTLSTAHLTATFYVSCYLGHHLQVRLWKQPKLWIHVQNMHSVAFEYGLRSPV